MEKRNNRVPRILGLAGAALLAGAGALLWSARKVSGFATWYAEAVYPVLVGSIGRFFGLFPFSVVEIGLYLLVPGLLLVLFRFRKRPSVALSACFFTVSALLFSYAVCCGVNYYRLPFSSYYIKELSRTEGDGTDDPAETYAGAESDGDEDLKGLCAWLTEGLCDARAEFERAGGNYEGMQEKGIAAMKKLAETYPALAGYYPRPKPVAVSPILSVQQCSGVYSPFTVEANYNRDMEDYNIPHTICHEMSHLRGFMREDEANFIGYLACLNSDDPDFRYSGFMLGWIYAGNALAKTDQREYARLHAMLPEAVREEFAENNAFWDRYEGTVAEAADKVNDTYLKVNGQAEGVRIVDLMLLDYRKNCAKN